MRFVTSLAVLVMTAASAHATVLLTEDFNSYADGQLAAVSSGKWTEPAATTGLFTVASNKLSINDESASLKNIFSPLSSTVSTGKVYASYKMTVSATDFPTATYTGATITSAGPYVSGFTQASSGTLNFTSKVFTARKDSAAGAVSTDPYSLGVTRNGGTVATTATITLWGTKLTTGTEYQIVTAYDFDTSTSTLWVNPTSEASPSVTNATGSNVTGSIGFYAFHIQTTADGDKLIDDLKIATTFAEAVPEPTAFGLIGIGSFMALRRRRRVER